MIKHIRKYSVGKNLLNSKYIPQDAKEVCNHAALRAILSPCHSPSIGMITLLVI